MYDEYPGKPARKVLGIGDSQPTNPQAEVLVFDRIEPELIGGVAFATQSTMDSHKAYAKGRPVKLFPGLFNPRVDYPHWK